MTLSVARITLVLFASWLAVGPLALVQLGAWSWMVGSYAKESSFEQAIRETFGGERPCDVCNLIEDIQDEQPGSSEIAPSKELKLMLGLAKAITVAQPEPVGDYDWPLDDRYQSYRDSLPSPPPRVG